MPTRPSYDVAVLSFDDLPAFVTMDCGWWKSSEPDDRVAIVDPGTTDPNFRYSARLVGHQRCDSP